jgi:hypothetical protein
MNSMLTKAALGLICATLGAGAFADPREGGTASCQGYEAADVSPPGSEDGTFSRLGMPGILAFIDLIVASNPLLPTRGAVIAFFANLHAGSHEACDAAAGVPPEAE